MANLKVQIFKSINEIDPEIWDRVVVGRGFQSHQWYQFGERAMADCPATYLIAWDEKTPVAGAALFRVSNEPFPLPEVARRFMASVFKRRPLLVCRSPLADTSALLLPGEPLRDEALGCIARLHSRNLRSSTVPSLFSIICLLNNYDIPPGPKALNRSPFQSQAPTCRSNGKVSKNILQKGNKKDRQHYKASLREAEENGLVLSKSTTISDVDAALN